MIRILTSTDRQGSSPTLRRPVAAVAIAATAATAGALILTVATPAHAGIAISQTRYVRITGDDAPDDTPNDCTDVNNPCLTVQHAVSEAFSGDTVDIGAGTFDGAEAATINLTFIGAGAGQTILEADPASLDSPVLQLIAEDAASYTVQNLTIQANAEDDGIDMAAGGNLTVNGVVVTDAGGPGIYVSRAADVMVEFSSVINDAAERGSAIQTADEGVNSLTLQSDSVSHNGSDNNNTAAVDASGTTVNISDSTIADNASVGAAAFDSGTTITGTTISGNDAGGILIAGGTLALSNSTVAANPADNTEPTFGAVEISSDPSNSPASATIMDSTISAAASGEGVVTDPPVQFNLVHSAAARSRRSPAALTQATNTASLTGTIILAPGESVACDDGSGGITDGGYNIASDDSCDFADATSLNSTDPSLGALADNGGSTQTMLPGSNSPAIDRIPANNDACLATDQRDEPRPAPVGGLCDIGSVEVQTVAPPGQPEPKSTPIVTLTAAPPGGAAAGQPVTLTATVTGSIGAPTGTVDFTDGGMAISAACSAAALTTTDNVTSATCDIPAGITPGVHSFTATYSGDVNYTVAADTISYPPSSGGTKPRIVAHVHSKVHRHHGWYRKSVRITFTCIPGSAPLVPPCPSKVRLHHNGAGQVVTRTIRDTAGASASVTVRISIDKRRPAVRIRGLHHHHVFQHAPTLSCVAQDSLSGVAWCHLRQRITSPDHHLIHNGRTLIARGEKLVAAGHAAHGQALIARGQHLVELGQQSKVVHVIAVAKDVAGNVHRRHARYDLRT